MFLEQFIKTVATVNFRTAPVNGSIIRNLARNTVLEVIGVDTISGWYNAVLSDGTVGYITPKSQYVEECEPVWIQTIRSVVLFGEKYLGTPYKFSSNRNDDSLFDCSDFTRWTYREFGYSLGSNSRIQSTNGIPSDQNDLRSGDLIFFAKPDGYIHHVAIYTKVDNQDRILHTYNTTCDIFDRNLTRIRTGGGGVTYSDFSPGSSWRNRANFDTRRIVDGERFAL